MIRRAKPGDSYLPTEVVVADEGRRPTYQGVSYGCFDKERQVGWTPKKKRRGLIKWFRDMFLS
ncbi:MAG: hypothetical protein HYV68_02665 [Candidatus Taylorbacteria bacterium]|nr:hypothetical protein [Candidatus Taylorbacteria bacterium]